MKVKLTKVGRYTENKDGMAYISKKTGKPFTICRIWTVEHGDKPIGGFDNQTTSEWKEGDEVEIIIKENGQWLNFDIPSDKVTRKEFDEIVKRVDRLEYQMHSRGVNTVAAEPMSQKDNDDLPF